MAKRVTCFYKIFGMKNAGPGLKDSGIGNCKICNDDQNENKKCKAYLEICIEEEYYLFDKE